MVVNSGENFVSKIVNTTCLENK